MYLENFGTKKEIQEIIKCLDWEDFYKKLDQGVLQLVQEFYANLDEGVDNKVIVRGKWFNMSNETIYKLIGAPDHDEKSIQYS